MTEVFPLWVFPTIQKTGMGASLRNFTRYSRISSSAIVGEKIRRTRPHKFPSMTGTLVGQAIGRTVRAGQRRPLIGCATTLLHRDIRFHVLLCQLRLQLFRHSFLDLPLDIDTERLSRSE